MKTPGLAMWTVYDHPLDYPNKYVARRFDGETPSQSIIIADSLELLRDVLCFEMHLTPLSRSPEDDPKIIETWL